MGFDYSSFVPLHIHTEYSLLDGASNISELVARAKELNMPAIAITDHGTMSGAVKFFSECKSAGIKPIIGCEVYTAERTMHDKDAALDRKSGHLVLLAKNETGYKNLIKIVSDAYAEGFYYKPRTDKNNLRKYSEGLIALSACLAGKIQRLILDGKTEEAKQEALEMNEIFGQGNFYLELQDHGQPEDKGVISELIKISKETNIPLVCTNDSHYVKKEDAEAQDVLMCLQMKNKLTDTNRMKMSGPEYYLKSGEEMHQLFYYIEEAIANTKVIADKCNFEFEFGNYKIPSFDYPKEFNSSYDYFKSLCEEGFEKKYPNDDGTVRDRLNYEMMTIREMGFVEYFLIVWDFINYGKSQGIAIGPGRGSAAGSVVSYCLDITEIDPIKYHLFFERFLNPERVSMPDIDIDFCIIRKEEIFEYVKEKYGEDFVCQIATKQTMKSKMAIRDVARVMDMPYQQADALAKKLPDKTDIKTALAEDPDFLAEYNKDPFNKRVVDMAAKLEGTARQVSTHPAGVVISSLPIRDLVPTFTNDSGIIQTTSQYEAKEIETLGLLKMDFLSLRNLTVMQETMELIKEGQGKDVSVDSLDLADPKVFDMIGKGDTVGVFQLESAGIAGFMKELKPTKFEDIIAGVALYRPGPMDSIPEYLENKEHPENIRYATPKLKPILEETYGIIVYQEQVMQIVRELAGYSFARADVVRKAMAKKQEEKMIKEKEYFINGKTDKNGNIEIPGCVRNGIDRQTASDIFDSMVSFAQYAFNKSHATAYAVITYQTAWLKLYYPSEFMAASMSSLMDKPDHLYAFMKDATKIINPCTGKRIEILPPSVLLSKSHFSVENGNIRFGLNAIKGVGKAVADDIEAKRTSGADFSNLYSFLDALEPKSVNLKAIENLILCGALKDVIPNINSGYAVHETAIKLIRDKKKRQNSDQISMFDFLKEDITASYPEIPILEEYPQNTLLSMEKELTGFYLTGHPLHRYFDIIKKNVDMTAEEFNNPEVRLQTLIKKYGKLAMNAQRNIVMAGIITQCSVKYTKKDKKKIAFLTVEDMDENIFQVNVFSREYLEFSPYLAEGSMIAVMGSPSQDDALIAKDMVALSEIESLTARISGRLTVEEQERQKKKQEASRKPRAIVKIVCSDSQLPKIRELAMKNPGNAAVLLYSPENKTKGVYADFRVNAGVNLMNGLVNLVGESNVKIQKNNGRR